MTVLYTAWRSMKLRCYRADHQDYRLYGERGITVCDRWRFGENGKTGFECWREDMGPKPTPEHTLDRIDNNGHYEPSNCRWATRFEQTHNRRPIQWPVRKGIPQDHSNSRRWVRP